MAKSQSYRVTKRFNVWAECSVKAKSIEEALDQGKKLKWSDFVEPCDSVDIIDSEELKGLSVGEEW